MRPVPSWRVPWQPIASWRAPSRRAWSRRRRTRLAPRWEAGAGEASTTVELPWLVWHGGRCLRRAVRPTGSKASLTKKVRQSESPRDLSGLTPSAVRVCATLAEVLGCQDRIGPVVVHPGQVLPARVDDA